MSYLGWRVAYGGVGADTLAYVEERMERPIEAGRVEEKAERGNTVTVVRRTKTTAKICLSKCFRRRPLKLIQTDCSLYT